MREVATALAILGESNYYGLLSLLAGIPSVALAQAQHALNGAGITESHRFRHPLSRTAVLDSRVVNVTFPGRFRQAGPRYRASATTWIRRSTNARDSRLTMLLACSVFDRPSLGV